MKQDPIFIVAVNSVEEQIILTTDSAQESWVNENIIN